MSRMKSLQASAQVERIFKSINNFPMTPRDFMLGELTVLVGGGGAQKRRDNIDPDTGADPKAVDAIFDKLDEGTINEADLFKRDPMIVCGIKGDDGAISAYVVTDGYTRRAALLRYRGAQYTVNCQYFEATQRELWIASGSVNADNGNPLRNHEQVAMFKEYLQDLELAQLSDAALSQLMRGHQSPRNLGNIRRQVCRDEIAKLIKTGDMTVEQAITTCVQRYLPPVRKGLDGREIKSPGYTETLDSFLDDPEFAAMSQPNYVAPAKAPKSAPAPATKSAPAPATNGNFVSSRPERVDEPTGEAQASGFSFDGVGEFYEFDEVEFSTSKEYGTVEIHTDQGVLVIPISTLKKFIEAHDREEWQASLI